MIHQSLMSTLIAAGIAPGCDFPHQITLIQFQNFIQRAPGVYKAASSGEGMTFAPPIHAHLNKLMNKIFTVSICCLLAACYSFAQVKSNYQYSTTMPYGTLDIRTRVSSSEYYYLQENKTFSFRESSPGVRTNKYLDMTSWDSSPYKEGNLRHRIGTVDKFVMNYRLLFPLGYNSTYAQGYPMMVHFHGAYERGNCVYTTCYHSTPSYTVEANSPPAPKTATHRLLNNDHNLNVGGKQYLDARNLAGTRLPHDPMMPSRAFPGFVLSVQMFNVWDSLQVQHVIRVVRLLTAKYKIDQDRIYAQGLSIGGYAVYESMKRASWLIAAGLPMAAVWDANIFTQNQQGKVAHIPLWVFQGGLDTRPSPAFTEAIITKYRNAGGIVRYTLYSNLGHVIWNNAYATTDYFSWMLKQSKANLHAYKGITVIDKSKSQYPKLFLAEGFLAYQWEKDGVLLGNKTHTLTVTTPGKYRARFSRKSAYPTEAQWNKWSPYVTITQTTTTTATASARMTTAEEVKLEPEDMAAEGNVAFEVYPNPASADNINLDLRGLEEAPLQVRIVDQLGRELYNNTFESPSVITGRQLALPPNSKAGVYILMLNQGQRQLRKKVIVNE